MKKIKKKNLFMLLSKSISIMLSAVIFWQGVVWASSDLLSQKTDQYSVSTLQTKTIFTSPESFDIPTPELIEKIIDKQLPKISEATLRDIETILVECDFWKNTYNRNYEWKTNTERTELIIIFKDSNDQVYCKIRYYYDTSKDKIRLGEICKQVSRLNKAEIIPEIVQKNDNYLPDNISDNTSLDLSPGAGFDENRNIHASMLGIVSGILLIMVSSIYPGALNLITATYVAYLIILPFIVSKAVQRALYFPENKYKLIKPFLMASDISKIKSREDGSLRRISYYSFRVAKALREREHDFKSPLFVDKNAMSHLNPFFQWIIYIHELLHSKFKSATELAVVFGNYTIPSTLVLLVLSLPISIFCSSSIIL
ncbi:MAG: hypothetical protein HQL29_03790, partial [Candidatus Omnitrophica bacterium]|nr:hypothetical protein [Candidatus Omnitrophota bacterium]